MRKNDCTFNGICLIAINNVFQTTNLQQILVMANQHTIFLTEKTNFGTPFTQSAGRHSDNSR